MAEKKVLLCLIKRKYRCPTWGFRSIQGDSPKNLAPGVRLYRGLYTIDFGKSPPIPRREGAGHFVDTCIILHNNNITHDIIIYITRALRAHTPRAMIVYAHYFEE